MDSHLNRPLWLIPMYCKQQLITDGLPIIMDSKLLSVKDNLIQGQGLYTGENPNELFKSTAHEYFSSSKRNTLHGLDLMPYTDIIMGCQHFIDNLIMKHGLGNLQILEHDYKYYSRLNPNIQYAVPGQLSLGVPLIIAAPFPGYLDLHSQWDQLINECNDKNIDVHIDGAWLSSASGISIDLTQPCIKSFGTSLSKGLGLSWNRIGLRWTKDQDVTDSITILNRFNMIPQMLCRTAIGAMTQIPVDYLWDTYEEKYFEICSDLKLRPSKIIHAAKSLDRSQLFGLKNFFS